jgi:hypothetical protein
VLEAVYHGDWFNAIDYDRLLGIGYGFNLGCFGWVTAAGGTGD